MIIRGPVIFGEGAMPIFSKNYRLLHCAFKKIRSNVIDHF